MSVPHPAPVLWLTGFSGAGKSTIAQGVAAALREQGQAVLVIDGDALRSGLCSDLGFGDADRSENIRRAAELAKLAAQSGICAVVALISPFRKDRAAARAVVSPARFVEVFVDAPLSLVESRDPKGLYARARRGELKQFTGIDSPYEAPTAPELHLRTDACTVDDAVQQVLRAQRAAD